MKKERLIFPQVDRYTHSREDAMMDTRFYGGVTPNTSDLEKETEFPAFVFNHNWYVLGKRPFNPIIRRVFDRFGEYPAGSWIIEPGCGDFRLGRLLIQRDWRIHGYDKSPTAVSQSEAAIKDMGLPDKVTLADFTEVPWFELVCNNPCGAFSWRVLHTMSPEVCLTMCRKIRTALVPGCEHSFFLSLLSDTSWERVTLGDKYVPGAPNDLREVMEFDRLRSMLPPEQRHLLPEHWLFSFFNEQSIRQLARDTGFDVHGDIVAFQEASAWPHLSGNHPYQTWLFAEFKPFEDDVLSSSDELRISASAPGK